MDQAKDYFNYVVYDELSPALVVVWTAIDWAFTEYLLLSNIISAGLLLGLGDFLVQTTDNITALEGGWMYDSVRSRRTVAVGFFLGVFNHVWYAILDSLLIGATLTTVLKKIALDQAIAGPFFCTAFFIGMGIFERKNFGEIFTELREKFIEVYKADWMFWPAAQFINFYLIPHRFRVIYVNLATLLWNTFLSYMKHRIHPTKRHSRLSYRPIFRRKRKSSSFTKHSRSRSGSRSRNSPGKRKRSKRRVSFIRIIKRGANSFKKRFRALRLFISSGENNSSSQNVPSSDNSNPTTTKKPMPSMNAENEGSPKVSETGSLTTSNTHSPRSNVTITATTRSNGTRVLSRKKRRTPAYQKLNVRGNSGLLEQRPSSSAAQQVTKAQTLKDILRNVLLISDDLKTLKSTALIISGELKSLRRVNRYRSIR